MQEPVFAVLLSTQEHKFYCSILSTGIGIVRFGFACSLLVFGSLYAHRPIANANVSALSKTAPSLVDASMTSGE